MSVNITNIESRVCTLLSHIAEVQAKMETNEKLANCYCRDSSSSNNNNCNDHTNNNSNVNNSSTDDENVCSNSNRYTGGSSRRRKLYLVHILYKTIKFFSSHIPAYGGQP